MKNYPAIWFAILFIVGIIIDYLSGVTIHNYFMLFILLVVSAAAAIYALNLKRNRITFLFSISLFVALSGIFISEFQKPNYNFLPGEMIRENNVKAFGSVKNVELIKKSEIFFNLYTDSVTYSENRLKGKYDIICRVREPKLKRLDSLYNIIKPGNKVEISGLFMRGRDRRNPGEFDYNQYLHRNGISGFIISNSVD